MKSLILRLFYIVYYNSFHFEVFFGLLELNFEEVYADTYYSVDLIGDLLYCYELVFSWSFFLLFYRFFFLFFLNVICFLFCRRQHFSDYCVYIILQNEENSLSDLILNHLQIFFCLKFLINGIVNPFEKTTDFITPFTKNLFGTIFTHFLQSFLLYQF